MISETRHDEDTSHREAREWLGRIQASELSDEARAEFEQWLQASPAHRSAFERAHTVWSLIGQSDQIENWVNDSERSDAAVRSSRSAPLFTTRRIAIGAAFAASVALVLSMLRFYPAPSEPQLFASAIAQTKTVPLEDGSVLTLAGSSEIKVAFTKDRRSIELLKGSVFFDVVRNADRPMTVTAADTQVHVVGTAFGIRYGSRDVRVAVTKGKVLVTGAADAASTPVALIAGEQATADLRGHIVSQGRADIEAELAWIKGRFVYDGARLVDVIDDINRYRLKKIELDGERVMDIRITTSFDANQIDQFVASLPLAYPVQVSESLDRTVVSAPR
ncbi:FecR domain-containing protein [Steroidobacter sp. S1-65]|uniref:FecR domain-containing protein n=1 Tax=Steroidobacter gossypii TaxID=2805490 RepID=A0ABS1WXN2_9GAMM|nr:FecR domain-containing protein [Steroidobacter gossypii]MBM0105744.1 FecR domain-containing protein [Steroidobacter gossypii]